MKKSMLFAAIVAVLCFSVNTSAQTKYEIKDAKKAAKVLQKEGWKTNGGTRSIESYLIAYNQLAAENELLQGRSSGISGNNTKVAQSLAKQNALREYVQMNNSFFEGVGNELEGKVGGETIDNITNAVKSKFVGSVEGKMKVSFVLFKTEADGTLSCIAYCYLSSAAAEAAKESARQQAMQEASKDAKSVKDFNASVNEIIEAGK